MQVDGGKVGVIGKIGLSAPQPVGELAITADIGEALLSALEKEGEPRVIEAEQLQDGGVLVALKSQLDAEREEVQQVIDEEESDALIAKYESIDARLEDVERQLAAFVGFDSEQKKLAGCFVSIGQDGSPHLDKGLVKPEHRRQLAKLLAAKRNRKLSPNWAI